MLRAAAMSLSTAAVALCAAALCGSSATLLQHPCIGLRQSAALLLHAAAIAPQCCSNAAALECAATLMKHTTAARSYCRRWHCRRHHRCDRRHHQRCPVGVAVAIAITVVFPIAVRVALSVPVDQNKTKLLEELSHRSYLGPT